MGITTREPTYTVPETCARLDRTERSVWGYVTKGLLRRYWREDDDGTIRAVFKRSEVDALRKELNGGGW